ncbi:MbtH family protein [Aquabacterium sp.]|uniref:MbtH family protein n=1 Tax=Aquabacterium sp. TaxID=1872578 RepID=UPI0035ADE10E
MSNPFDTPDTATLVLQNDEQQYSLWPSFLPLPKGWTAVHGPAPRAECLTYVDTHWTDLRPASLRNAA